MGLLDIGLFTGKKKVEAKRPVLFVKTQKTQNGLFGNVFARPAMMPFGFGAISRTEKIVGKFLEAEGPPITMEEREFLRRARRINGGRMNGRII